MSQLQECPNCLKYKIGVTLEEKEDSMVCPACDSAIENYTYNEPD